MGFRNWPILGGCTLAAVMLGVHLGESSIGLIKPIHFQGPAPHPRERGAAIDEPLPAPARASYYEAYGWEQGQAALAGACDGCTLVQGPAVADRGPRSYSAVVPYFGGSTAPRMAAGYEPFESDIAAAQGERVGPDAFHSDQAASVAVHRYAHYPVSADEMEPEGLDRPMVAEPRLAEPVTTAY